MTTPSEESPLKYHIVLKYKAHVPGFAGNMTWTSFKSEEDFKKWYTADIEANEEVVAQGLSPEKAKEICGLTSLDSRLRAMDHESRDPSTGKVNQNKLAFLQRNLQLELLFSGYGKN